jgi:hypothetical protein
LSELAAAAWQIPLETAVRRIAAEGVPIPPQYLTDEQLALYVENFAGLRKKADLLWKQAQEKLVRGAPECAHFRQKLGLTAAMDRQRLRDGPAGYYGVLHEDDLRICFGHRGFNRHQVAGFCGAPGPVLAAPYFSAPQRLGGFYFYDSKWTPGHRLLRFDGTATPSEEMGLAGLNQAVDHPSATIVATDNLLMLLRLQTKHFYASLLPLPLVGWYHAPSGLTSNAWAALDHKKLVLWGMDMTPALVFQCQKTDAKLVIAGASGRGNLQVDRWLNSDPTHVVMQRLLEDAKPWQQVVKNWLQNGPQGKVSTFLSQMARIDDGIDLLRSCQPERFKAVQGRVRTVRLGNKFYVEQGHRWYEQMTERTKLIFPGIIRVDCVTTYRHAGAGEGANVYHGKILYGGKEIPFRTGISLNTSGRTNWAIMALNEAGVSAVDIPSKQPQLLLKLALAFHEPAVVKGHRTIGYVKNGYRFKHFDLRGGKAQERDERSMPPDCPGPQSMCFKQSKQLWAQMSQPGEHHEMLWSMLVTALAAATGQARGLVDQTSIVTGDYAYDVAVAVLSRAGIPLWKPTYNKRYRWRHHWPVYIRAVHAHLNAKGAKLVGVLRRDVAYSKALHGLPVLSWPKPLPAQAIADFPIEHAVLGYLRYTTGLTHTFPEAATHWESICADVAQWLDDSGCGDVVRGCSRFVQTPDDPSRFARACAWLYKAGRLVPNAKTRGSRKRVSTCIDGAGLHVEPEQLQKVIAKYGFIPIPDLPDDLGTIHVSRDMLRQEFEPWRRVAAAEKPSLAAEIVPPGFGFDD